ncbi:hypothetical protein DFH27DRAFT_600214 [Peziza echinospora]|nr:hypothetical protein DFH27DRAFT_600214 [Peziza echinospora]
MTTTTNPMCVGSVQTPQALHVAAPLRSATTTTSTMNYKQALVATACTGVPYIRPRQAITQPPPALDATTAVASTTAATPSAAASADASHLHAVTRLKARQGCLDYCKWASYNKPASEAANRRAIRVDDTLFCEYSTRYRSEYRMWAFVQDILTLAHIWLAYPVDHEMSEIYDDYFEEWRSTESDYWHTGNWIRPSCSTTSKLQLINFLAQPENDDVLRRHVGTFTPEIHERQGSLPPTTKYMQNPVSPTHLIKLLQMPMVGLNRHKHKITIAETTQTILRLEEMSAADLADRGLWGRNPPWAAKCRDTLCRTARQWLGLYPAQKIPEFMLDPKSRVGRTLLATRISALNRHPRARGLIERVKVWQDECRKEANKRHWAEIRKEGWVLNMTEEEFHEKFHLIWPLIAMPRPLGFVPFPNLAKKDT